MSAMLFESFDLGGTELQNRIVMAPMTRCRCIGNIPDDIVTEYYSQRASAGLIVTEGTSPSPNGLGYPRIPGMFNDTHVNAWKKVTASVHACGGKIFMQLMHSGRVSHALNLPDGAKVLAPSAIQLEGEIYTDAKGLQAHSMPSEMTSNEIAVTTQEYVQAAQYAIAAGFDGIELHSANGYLLEQFICPATNQRTDEYGGSVENRLRFPLQLAEAVAEAIGKQKTAIRVSPYGTFNSITLYDELDETYALYSQRLSELGLAYLHVVDHSSMGAPVVPDTIKATMRKNFKQAYILSGGYDLARAEEDLKTGKGDLVAFGKPFISNPDLIARLKSGATLAQPDFDTFYTPGEKGYTDYPAMA